VRAEGAGYGHRTARLSKKTELGAHWDRLEPGCSLRDQNKRILAGDEREKQWVLGEVPGDQHTTGEIRDVRDQVRPASHLLPVGTVLVPGDQMLDLEDTGRDRRQA
jgi:hypothetical protein